MPMNKYGYDVDDPDEVYEILYKWETLEEEKIDDEDRWNTYFSKVVKSPLGFSYKVSWAKGSTENQDCDLKYQMVRVKPFQVTTTTYVKDED